MKALIGMALALTLSAHAQTTTSSMETTGLTQVWDKTFPQSEKVAHEKVTFRNRFGIT